MHFFSVSIFLCFVVSAFSWEYPGYPGVDCPTARQKMQNDPKTGWMIPKCHDDGTYQDMQCFDKYPGWDDACMCVAPDGTPITLPGFGVKVKTCVCLNEQYRIFKHDPNAEELNCENTGYYAPLQCSKKSGECSCVDKFGNVLVPPSTQVHSCDNSE